MFQCLQTGIVPLAFSALVWNCLPAVPDIVCVSCAAATPAPGPMAGPPQDAESDKVVGNPASDTCVVELMLPDDARVVADGVEYGIRRQLTFPHLEPQQARPMRLKIVYPGGVCEERTILLRGGTLIRLSRSGPEGPGLAPVIQSGHFDEITAAAFSPDGRYLATGSQDGRTILWDVRSGKQLQTLHGFLSFRAPASRKTERAATDTRVLQMQGCHYVPCVCFSPDGRRLLSICVPQPDFEYGCFDSTAIVWDVDRGKPAAEIAIDEAIQSVSFTGDSRFVVGVSFPPTKEEDGTSEDSRTPSESSTTIVRWDAATGKKTRTTTSRLPAGLPVASSPDGQIMLVLTDDNQLAAWDPANNRKKFSQPTTEDLTVAAISCKGAYLATANRNTLTVRNGATRSVMYEIRLQTLTPRFAAFSRDSRFLVLQARIGGESHRIAGDESEGRGESSTSQDEQESERPTVVLMYDAETGREIRRWEVADATSPVSAISPDGSLVLTVAEGRTGTLWKTDGPAPAHVLVGSGDRTDCVAFSPDGTRILSGALLWSTKQTSEFRTLADSRAMYVEGAFSPDSERLFLASHLRNEDGAGLVSLFPRPDMDRALVGSIDLRTGEASVNQASADHVSLDIRNWPARWHSFAFGSEESQIFVIFPDGTTVLSQGAIENKVRSFPGRYVACNANCIAASRDGALLATSMLEHVDIWWDLQSGKKLREERGERLGPGSSAAWESEDTPLGNVRRNGNREFATTESGDVDLRDVKSGKVLKHFPVHGKWGVQLGVDCDDEGTDGTLCTRVTQPVLLLWDARTGRELHSLPNDGELAQALMFSADGKTLYGVVPRQILCWDTATGKLARTSQMAGPEALVSASFAPDGRWMATAGTDNQLDVWDVATGAKLQSFEQPFGIAYQLAFGPDGRHLLSVAQGGSFLWDVATGVRLAELVSFEQGKDWLVFTPEGPYDGSPGASKRLMFRGHGESDSRPDQDVDSARFPGLLSALLKGDRPLPEKTPASDAKL